MAFLTGQKDTDLLILQELDDESLQSICQVNKFAKALCDKDTFWMNRIISKYGLEILKGKEIKMTYREYYTSGKARTYKMCKDIEGVKHLSLMVASDFYDPQDGLLNANFTRDTRSMVYLLLKIVLTRMTSFEPRDYEQEEKLKKAVIKAAMRIPDYRRDDFDVNSNFMTKKEQNAFIRLINIPVGRPAILRSASRNRPDMVRAFPNPEKQFLLIAHIHKGFRTRQIPLDIFWDELCTLPYIQNYKY